MSSYDPSDDAPAWSTERAVAEQLAAEIMGQMAKYFPYTITPYDWRVKVTNGALWANLEIWFDIDRVPSLRLAAGQVYTDIVSDQGDGLDLEPLQYYVVSLEIDQVPKRMLKLKFAFEIARLVMTEQGLSSLFGEVRYVRDKMSCFGDPVGKSSTGQSA